MLAVAAALLAAVAADARLQEGAQVSPGDMYSQMPDAVDDVEHAVGDLGARLDEVEASVKSSQQQAVATANAFNQNKQWVNKNLETIKSNADAIERIQQIQGRRERIDLLRERGRERTRLVRYTHMSVSCTVEAQRCSKASSAKTGSALASAWEKSRAIAASVASTFCFPSTTFCVKDWALRSFRSRESIPSSKPVFLESFAEIGRAHV